MTAPARFIVLFLLLCTCAAAFAEKLDTLFTTPEERQRLDAVRGGGHNRPVTRPSTGAAPLRLRIGGVMRRPDGVNVVLLGDGDIIDRRQTVDGVVIDPARASVQAVVLELAGKSYKVKPGQTFEPKTGRILDQAEASATVDEERRGNCRRLNVAPGHTEIKC